jgi:hypothetical protein
MNQLLHNFNFFLVGVCVLAGVFFVMNQTPIVLAGTLSCSVATSGACINGGVVIYRMSGATNAHAELGNQSNVNYDNNVVCCTNVIGLGNSCSATTTATALKLSSTTNAHAEQNSQSNFTSPACISVPVGGAVTVGYQASNCTGFDTTLGSMQNATNTHIGNASAYTTKICASASGTPQTISFSISDNTIGFGALSAVQTLYASGDALGTTSSSSDAHTISIVSNASGGYSMTITGTTLTCSSCTNGATIAALGATPTAPSIGTEQFGTRITVNSGTGTTSAPYNTTNWALDTASFPDQIASGPGDSVTSIFGIKYMTNIATISEAGIYSAIITYTVTSTF